jgi:D-inositol-3-phosphate glycosyltransferase
MKNKPKHIIIVSHHYPPHITGVGLVAHNQAKNLVAAGHLVSVITSDTNKDEKSCNMDGVCVIRIKALNILEKWGAPFPIFSLKIFPVLLKSIKKADVVHVHDAFYMSTFFAVLCAHLYKKPIILMQHIAMIPHPSKFVVTIEKLVYATTGALVFRWSKSIITINDRVDKFLKVRGVSQSKLISLPNGVDTMLFHPVGKEEKKALRKQLGLSQNKKIILFVGRFVPKKGFDKVLAARNDEYQIVFAGGNPPHDSDEEILFLGKLSQKKLAQVYQASDIFVLPSQGEGFPLSVQEAMASGLPVITTKDEGYGRYRLDEKFVYLIENPTKDLVCQAIKTLVKDDDLLRNMSDYSYHYARTNFSWPLIISRIEKIYDDLATK